MIEIDHQPREHQYQARSAVWWRRSCLTSTVGHALLIVFFATDLAALLFLLLGLSTPPPGKREPIELVVQLEPDDAEEPVPEIVVDMKQYEAEEFFQSAEAVAGRLDFSDPALQQPLDYDYEPSANPDSPANDMQRFVQDNLEAAIESANEQTPEENLDRLDELARQLETTSSDASINAVSSFVGSMLGTKERATRPSEEPVAGVFDSQTGQIDDVIRKERDPEGYIYIAILVDAEGREIEVELTGPEGKQAFDTFEKIKQYPFLDKIYRGVVMSLLDGMINQ